MTPPAPSLAELEACLPQAIDINIDDDSWNESRDAIIAAAPALIAIAKAALAYTRPVETEQDARDKETARRALLVALKAVRP